MAEQDDIAGTQAKLLKATIDAAGKVFKRSAAIDRIRKDAEDRIKREEESENQRLSGVTLPESATTPLS